MADFEADVTAFIAKAKHRMVEAYLGLGDAAVNRVKELTPVRTGNLRANWQLVVADAAKPVEPRTVPEGEPARPAPLTIELGQFLAVINPVEYARPVEFGYVRTLQDGSVKHIEGRHMLTQTFAELPQLAERVVRRMRARP